jgi:hypothetical protein
MLNQLKQHIMKQNNINFKKYVHMFLNNYITGFVQFDIKTIPYETHYLREIISKYNKKYSRNFSINKSGSEIFIYENDKNGASALPGAGDTLRSYQQKLLEKERNALKHEYFILK